MNLVYVRGLVRELTPREARLSIAILHYEYTSVITKYLMLKLTFGPETRRVAVAASQRHKGAHSSIRGVALTAATKSAG